ncbi:hypothetical protein [Mycobacterium sp. NPDC050441]|uniref:DUF7019 family protein n=1 Tax=Mycobacterium sp. NPDC050441 TaxID=3155403 RepID=UPI003410F458
MARWWKRQRDDVVSQSLGERIAISSQRDSARTLESVDLNVVDRPHMSYISQTKVSNLHANLGSTRTAPKNSVSSEASVNLYAIQAKVASSRESTRSLSPHHMAHDWTRWAADHRHLRSLPHATAGSYVAVRMPMTCGTLMVGNQHYPETLWWQGRYGGFGLFLTGHRQHLLAGSFDTVASATWIPSGEGSAGRILKALVADSLRDEAEWSQRQELAEIDTDWGTHLDILMSDSVCRGQHLWAQWADAVFRCDGRINDNYGTPIICGSPVWVKKITDPGYGWYRVVPDAYRNLNQELLPHYYAEWSGKQWTGVIGCSAAPNQMAHPEALRLPSAPPSSIPTSSYWITDEVDSRQAAEAEGAEELERQRLGLAPRPVRILDTATSRGMPVSRTVYKIARVR